MVVLRPEVLGPAHAVRVEHERPHVHVSVIVFRHAALDAEEGGVGGEAAAERGNGVLSLREVAERQAVGCVHEREAAPEKDERGEGASDVLDLAGLFPLRRGGAEGGVLADEPVRAARLRGEPPERVGDAAVTSAVGVVEVVAGCSGDGVDVLSGAQEAGRIGEAEVRAERGAPGGEEVDDASRAVTPVAGPFGVGTHGGVGREGVGEGVHGLEDERLGARGVVLGRGEGGGSDAVPADLSPVVARLAPPATRTLNLVEAFLLHRRADRRAVSGAERVVAPVVADCEATQHFSHAEIVRGHPVTPGAGVEHLLAAAVGVAALAENLPSGGECDDARSESVSA